MKDDIVLFLLVIALVVAMATRARAEEHQGHALYHNEFYSKWQRANGAGSCCNEMDCHPIDDKDVRSSGEELEVKIQGEWIHVDKEKIRPYQAPDMNSHLCNVGKMVYCYVYGGGM